MQGGVYKREGGFIKNLAFKRRLLERGLVGAGGGLKRAFAVVRNIFFFSEKLNIFNRNNY